MTQADRRALLKKLIKSGIQISPDALDFLLGLEAPMSVVDSLVGQRNASAHPSVLSREYIAEWLTGENEKRDSTPTVTHIESFSEEIEPESEPHHIEADPLIRIIKNPTYDTVGSKGTVDDFLALFRDRFHRIKRMYASRVDTHDALSPAAIEAKQKAAAGRPTRVSEGQRAPRRSSVKVIGIVKEKSVSKAQNVVVNIETWEKRLNKHDEDEEYSVEIVAVIPTGQKGEKGQQLSEKASSVLLDEVVCISGYLDEYGRMIADDVILPDIPMTREVGRAQRDVYAAFISDIHCGSSEFLEDEFDLFIDWLGGRDVDSSEKQMVNQIKYLLIAGDLVDGIGVYPEQRSDLATPDIHNQYAILAEKLRRIPDDVKILCIPGNHDAGRQALPRPPIAKEFAGSLYNLGDRLMMFGDPCQLIIEGVNIIMTHGDSLDDLVTSIPGASYEKPTVPMAALLRKRHLAPIYGGKTELAPLHRDWMVIDTPPDLIHFGHAHHNETDAYRSVQIINSGTFQGQTEFMRKQGIKPTPGIVTLMNLMTRKLEARVFYNSSPGS
ncbi:MAG: metallophosphoesterase [Candidatus Thorarchaeota archaeon]|nr:MAG: metallophosphoesterase [Candidatus Thorarchaeota archaeon]